MRLLKPINHPLSITHFNRWRCINNSNDGKSAVLANVQDLKSLTSSSIRASSSSAAAAASASSTKLKNYAAISRTLYKQILRWTKDMGDDVPLDSIPPLTLSPPLIEKTSLEHLSLIQTQNSENDNDYDHHDKNDRMLLNLLPNNTIFDKKKIVIPIDKVSSIHNTAKFVFGMNHRQKNNNKGKTEQNSNSNSEDATTFTTNQLPIIKDRVSLGFEVLKSLNQLSEMLDERKEARIKHHNRNGVLYHVGQVVQHKTQRWRAIVAGWDKRKSDAIDNLYKFSAGGTNNSNTSLTTKLYKGDDSGMIEDNDDNEEGYEIEYTVFLDEGDAVLMRARVLGSKKVKQEELEPVYDPYLKRIRCSMSEYLFECFDPSKNEFRPGEILSYEYPLDNASTTHVVGKDADSIDETELDNIQECNDRGQKSAQVVVHCIQQFASKWLEDISDVITSRSSSSEEHAKMILISRIKQELENIVGGHLLQNARNILTPATPASVQKEAITYVNALLKVIQRVNEIMWHRRTTERHKHRTTYALGDIVKHKKYNFRGIITGYDTNPRTDVSRWDGLQHIKGDVNDMTFYHVLADSNDTAEAFGTERPYRYVCQENLEHCPVDEKNNLDLDLYPGWSVVSEGTLDVKYIAPDEVKFQHSERLENGIVEDIIQKCMGKLLMDIHVTLINIREKGDVSHVQLDDLLNILQQARGFEDAYTIEEFIKEIWKAHKSIEIRWALEDGSEALLRGDKMEALNIFDDIINNKDSKYSEAYNKKSTCHYMVGEMGKSIHAAESACEIEPRHFQAFAGLGLVYNDKGQYSEASKCFRKSLILQPWSPVSSRLTVCLDLMKRLNIKEEGND